MNRIIFSATKKETWSDPEIFIESAIYGYATVKDSISSHKEHFVRRIILVIDRELFVELLKKEKAMKAIFVKRCLKR